MHFKKTVKADPTPTHLVFLLLKESQVWVSLHSSCSPSFSVMGRLVVTTLFLLFIEFGALLPSSLACTYCPYPMPPTKPPKHHHKSPPKHHPKVKPPPFVRPKPPPSVQPPLPPIVGPKPPPFVMPPRPPIVGPKPPPFVHPPSPPIVGPKPPPFVMPPIVRPKPPPFVRPPFPPIVGPKPPPVVEPPKPPIIGPKPPPSITPPVPPIVGPRHPPRGKVPCPPPPPSTYPPVVPFPPPPPSPPPPPATCPVDALKLGACVDLLGGLIHIGIGREAKATCCPLIQGVADLDAALCLCTTIRAKLLNINIFLPIALELLITCGKHPPPGYQCPAPIN